MGDICCNLLIKFDDNVHIYQRLNDKRCLISSREKYNEIFMSTKDIYV